MAVPLLTILTPLLAEVITSAVSDKSQARNIITSVTDKLTQREAEMSRAITDINTAQLEVNKAEAQHRSLFVAGWRPAIGWVCACALAWMFIGKPAAQSALLAAGYDIALPDLPHDRLFELTLGMLGMAGLRTWEKSRGLSR